MSTRNNTLDDIQIIPLLDTLKLGKVSDEVYFGGSYSQYISNSRLSLLNPLQDNDPEAFFEGLSKHNKYSDSLIFGSAVHELILQPELFQLATNVERPTAKLGFMADDLYKSYRRGDLDANAVIKSSDKIDYYKGKMNPDRIRYVIESCSNYWNQRKEYESTNKGYKIPIYLDYKSRDRVVECVDAINRNKLIQRILHPSGTLLQPVSENEQTILLDVEIRIPNQEPFIFKLKSKLDNYTIDFDTNSVIVNDLKTIGKPVSEFKDNFEKFHYFRELALYSWLMSLISKKYYNMENCTIISNCLIVSTIPNYYTKIYTLNRADFNKGWNEFKYLLRLAADYYNQGYRFS